jgi:hypothetical protein
MVECLFNLGAFTERDAMPHLCKQQPPVAFSAQGIERKYRKPPKGAEELERKPGFLRQVK